MTKQQSIHQSINQNNSKHRIAQFDVSNVALPQDSGIAWRLTAALFFGVVIAAGLTWFMHVLIESSHQELDQSIRASLLDFVRVERQETSQRKSVKPKRPQTQEAPASPSPQQTNQQLGDASINVALPSLSNQVDVDIGGIEVGTGDGEYLPIVKVAPIYPIKASVNGVEGDCIVEYTVTSSGATKDIRIVKGHCPKLFAKASIKAAKKFKYKPRVIYGEAIEVPNVKNKFKFRLASPGEQK